jgi:hypothetical protein
MLESWYIKAQVMARSPSSKSCNKILCVTHWIGIKKWRSHQLPHILLTLLISDLDLLRSGTNEYVLLLRKPEGALDGYPKIYAGY